MTTRTGVIPMALTCALLMAGGGASAQDLSKLGGMLGGGGASMKSGSMGNVTGLLQYCVQNNYLGGNSGAAGIKDKLLGKMGGASSTPMAGGDTSASKGDMLSRLTGGSKGASQGAGTATSDPGYLSGAKGVLQGGNGKSVDLNSLGGGNSDLKSKLTTKVCDTVLKQGKSFLGK
jgi:uncharacterized protein DUF2501